MGLRFLRFNLVGAFGLGVRLLVVAVLAGWVGLHYLVATAMASRCRSSTTSSGIAAGRGGGRSVGRANHTLLPVRGVPRRAPAWSSMLGAMVLMPLLVGRLGMHYLLANLVTVCATGLLNFFLATA